MCINVVRKDTDSCDLQLVDYEWDVWCKHHRRNGRKKKKEQIIIFKKCSLSDLNRFCMLDGYDHGVGNIVLT